MSPLASWPHLSGMYASKYYSYEWSNKYALKIYDKFAKTNNPKLLASKYMELLLEPGALMNYQDNLNEFLKSNT